MFDLEKKYTKWNRTRILRHVIYWGFWLMFYCIFHGQQFGQYFGWMVFELLAMTVKLPYVYFVTYKLMPRFIPKKRYYQFGGSMLLFAGLGSLLLGLIYANFPYEMGKNLDVTWSRYIYLSLDLLYVASFVVVIKLMQEYARQKKANAELAEDKVKAELQMLRNQLQPHFLFNTLNNIYSLVISNDKLAGGAVIKLSDILSYMLYECNVDKVPIEKEIKLIQNYIELEKIRYGGRLDLSFTVDGDTMGKQIPPLLLIPFIENAFKHGAAKSEKPSWIRIHLDLTGNELSFMVENDWPNFDTDASDSLKSGIGIQNITKRLELSYPGQYELRTTKDESYLINLRIAL